MPSPTNEADSLEIAAPSVAPRPTAAPWIFRSRLVRTWIVLAAAFLLSTVASRSQPGLVVVPEFTAAVFAQGGMPAPAAPVVGGAGRRADQYADSPFPSRGGDDQSGRSVGFYLSLGRLIPVIGLFFLWVYTARWADEDARGLKLDAPSWNTILLLTGVAGFAAVLLVPVYALGFLLMVASYAAPTGIYINLRNQHVPESSRLLTPRHIQTVLIRTLARFGLNLAPSKEARDKALGPPIRFIGKSASVKGRTKAVRARPRNRRGSWERVRWCTTPSFAARPTCISNRRPTSFRSGTVSTA